MGRNTHWIDGAKNSALTVVPLQMLSLSLTCRDDLPKSPCVPNLLPIFSEDRIAQG